MAHPFKASMVGGELSPNCYARVDLARYATSLRTCRNFIVRPYGGVTNRTGSKYITSVKTASKKTRLIPFIYSTETTYVLEFGDQYVRFYQNGVQLLNGGSPREISSPFLESELFDIRFTQSADVLTLCHPNHPPQQIARTSSTPTFTMTAYPYVNGPFLDLNTTATKLYASAISGTGVTLTASASLFSSADVGTIIYLESEDYSKIAPWEPSKALAYIEGTTPYGLMRRSDGKVYKNLTDYTIGNNDFPVKTGTVRPTHEKGVARDGDGNKVTNDAVIAGVEWEYQDSGYGIVKVTGYTNATTVTVDVLRQLPASVVGGVTSGGTWNYTGNGATTVYSITGAQSNDRTDYEVKVAGALKDPTTYTVNPTTDQLTFVQAPANGLAISIKENAKDNRTSVWAFGSWSTKQGYPSCVTYYQDRLVFGGTTLQPDALFLSKTSNYVDHGKSTPSIDDDAMRFSLTSRQVNSIRDLVPLDQLVALTAGAEWSIRGGQDSVLTPSSVTAHPQSYRGCSKVGARIIGNTAVYVQDRGGQVRDLAYSIDVDGYDGNDLTAFGDHLFDGYSITDMAFQQVPWSVLWCVRSDGVLLGLTYMREQQVLAWHWHQTDGYYESVCVVPEGSEDYLYVVVRRVVNGTTVRHIERFPSRRIATISDGFFVDDGITYSGSSTSTITGLGHLEGKTVAVLRNGVVESQKVVSSGQITLSAPGTLVHVGLPITAEIETLEVTDGTGDSRVAQKLIPRVDIIVRDTAGIKVGTDANHLYSLSNVSGLQNGKLEYHTSGTWNDAGRVLIRQDQPLPASILGVIPDVKAGR